MNQGIDQPNTFSIDHDAQLPASGVLRACTLLLVDDNVDDRQMVVGYLRRFDVSQLITVLEAATIEEGLRVLGQVRVSCVLIDHSLPDGDGIEFIKRALAHVDRRRMPIIMLTGRGSEHIAVAAMRLGASDYLTKSELSPDALHRAILRGQQIREMAQEIEESAHARNVAQMALQHNEVTLQRLVQSIGDYAILSLDAHGHVASWNLGARLLFDYHDQDVIGAHLRIFTGENDSSKYDPKVDLDRAQQQGVQRQARFFRRRDGSQFWGSGTLSPIRCPLGQLLGFAWVVHVVPQAPTGAADAMQTS